MAPLPGEAERLVDVELPENGEESSTDGDAVKSHPTLADVSMNTESCGCLPKDDACNDSKRSVSPST